MPSMNEERHEPWLEAFCEDHMEACSSVPDASVDLVVTSPPYKRKDGYSQALMLNLGGLLGRVLKPGGWVFMNFGQLQESYDRPFLAREALTRGPLCAWQTIIWAKSLVVPTWRNLIRERLDNPPILDSPLGLEADLRKILAGPGRVEQRGHFQSINSPKILNYLHEYVFILYKPPVGELDKNAIGVPYSDKTNLKRGTRGKDGDIHCAGDVWYVPYKTRGKTSKKSHVHEYPEELVERCIRLSGVQPGGTIYEPFLGGGTTVSVAKRFGLNAYGTDVSRAAIDGAVARWENT